MRLTLVAAAVIALGGCAITPGCYVGFNFIPPSPIVICGFDSEPKDD